MNRILGWLFIGFFIFSLSGCGSSHEEPAFFETSILSDPDVDGDIQDSGGLRTVSLVRRDALPSVFVGVDPVNGDEFRAFLDFPLTGVPVNAIIRSATLSFVLKSLTVVPPTAEVPIRVDLVSFDPLLNPPLVANYFDRTLLIPLLSTTVFPPLASIDVNHRIYVDVTQLMDEAQLRRLDDFEVRLLEDFGGTPGLAEIDESSDAVAPRLDVVYR